MFRTDKIKKKCQTNFLCNKVYQFTGFISILCFKRPTARTCAARSCRTARSCDREAYRLLPIPKLEKEYPWQGDGHSILGRKRRYYVGLFTQEKYYNWSVLWNLLDQLRTAIHEKRPGKLSIGVLLQQDNARVHTCKVAMDAVERNGYELVPHPAYSPNLAPSDFFLFQNLKKDIRGLHVQSDEEVVTAVEEWVNGKDPDFFSSGLMGLEHRWSKCITLEGNYIEKEEVDLNRK